MHFFAAPVRVPASSPYERDPRRLPRVSAESIAYGTSGTLWTAIDAVGDYQSSSPFTATRTIVDVSGRGTLLGCIGPDINGASASTTWTITVDGVAYTITHVHGDAGSTRMSILGAILVQPDTYITSGYSGGIAAATDLAARNADDTTYKAGTGTAWKIKAPDQITRRIVFDTSLKIQVACNFAPFDSKCGAIWNLDT